MNKLRISSRPWSCSFAALTILLAAVSPSNGHTFQPVEVRCTIVNDGYCTVHDKADLCTHSRFLTGRPKDHHRLFRIETTVSSTGPLPEQKGNLTVAIKCQLDSGMDCWPHVRTNKLVPSKEEMIHLTEAKLRTLDAELEANYIVAKQKRNAQYQTDVLDVVNNFTYHNYTDRIVNQMEHTILSPEQMAIVSSLATAPEKTSKTLEFQNVNKQKVLTNITEFIRNDHLSIKTLKFEKKYNDTVYPSQLDNSREKMGNLLRQEFCNSGQCGVDGKCTTLECGEGKVHSHCQYEDMDTEYELTVQQTLKKIQKSGSSRILISKFLSAGLLLVVIG